MKTIREGIFETNSSSTHAIVIPKKMDTIEAKRSWDNDYIFGRQESRLVDNIDEKIAYVWGILLSMYCETYWDDKEPYPSTKYIFKEEVFEHFEKMTKDICKKFYSQENVYIEEKDIIALFEYLKGHKQDRGTKIYVDHTESFSGENKEFVDKILNNTDDFYTRYLFSEDSYITVGGDEYRGYNIKTIGFEYDYGGIFEEDNEFWKKVEEYRKEHDVFFKGC